jgi:hypothetical protein
MTTVYVDSRYRVRGSDSDFLTSLRETLHLEGPVKYRIDNIRFTDAFLSTDRGSFVYYLDGAGGLSHSQLPPMAYSGTRLAAFLSSIGKPSTYSDLTNAITVSTSEDTRILTDAELRAFPASSFPPGATPSQPKSINHLLGLSFRDGGSQIFPFVSMNCFHDLYLRSKTLTSGSDIHGARGDHDPLVKISLNQGVGSIVVWSMPENVFHRLDGPTTLRNLDFSLTDVHGQVVDLRGSSLSFQIYFDT